MIVRGKKPFKILDVNCGDDCFAFKTDQESKPLHVVELTFNPGPQSGSLRVPVQITTDRGPNRGAKLMVSAKVVAPQPTAEPTEEPASETQADAAKVAVESARVAGTASK